MANLRFRTEMPHWEVKVFRTNITDILRPFISSIQCEYTTDDKGTKPPEAIISITSQWFIEEFFRDGVEVLIRMGWDRQNMATMIFGIVLFEPSGTAGSELSYRARIKSKIMELARRERIGESFHGRTKREIIAEISSRNDYDIKVSITDAARIPKDETIKQGNMKKGETDLELLYRLSRQWECVTWVDDIKKIIYFIDADRAHDFGDTLRIPTARDLIEVPQSSSYELHYKFGRNNIASLSWKKGPALKGDPSGKEPAFETLVAENKDKEADLGRFTIETEADGETTVWRLKESIKSKVAVEKVLSVAGEIKTANRKNSWLNKYFIPMVSESSKTIRNETNPRSDKRSGYGIDIGLNIGDEFLRPPRSAILKSGQSSGFSTNEDDRLPGFLFKSNTNGNGELDTRYNINKVTTSLSSGQLKTKILAHRPRQ